ncbi:MAG: FAD:protein FMN transferase [Xanthomonadales bacterium]|nr:FAD:protein FMN transferase [Xanthomonadales bacterium]
MLNTYALPRWLQRRHFWILIAITIAFMVSACQRTNQQHQARFAVFGTLVDVTIRDVEAAQADAAFRVLQALFQALHQEWHPWEDGALMQLNQAIATGQSHRPPQRLLALIEQALQAESDSCGLFNAASGGLVNLWGFHTSDYPILGPPPDSVSIQHWLAAEVKGHDLRIEKLSDQSNGSFVQVSHPQAQARFDLSGIAKGAAVALAMDHLHAMGIDQALINAGGDVLASTGDHQATWRVAIQHPFAEHQKVLASVEIQEQEAVFTSGNYARFRQDQEQRYAHILDPRSGYPVEEVAAATVIHPNAATADAAATALMVTRASEPWTAIAQRMQIQHALIIRRNGRIEMTPAMAARLDLREDPMDALEIIEVAPGPLNPNQADCALFAP